MMLYPQKLHISSKLFLISHNANSTNLLSMTKYSSTINSHNRTAFAILLDRSGSMAEPISFNGQRVSKAEALAEVTNRLIFELLCRARRSDGVRNYFDVALIGYAGDALQPIVGNRKGFIPITEFDQLARVETSRGGFALPHWVAPVAEGSTPMFEALLEASEMVEEWCARPENAHSYPPTIFNITDGEASDGDHADIAEISDRLRSCSTTDGNALLINIHLASTEKEQSIIFPRSIDELGHNYYARLLYECASEMPSIYSPAIASLRNETIGTHYRGVCFNASAAEVIAMMNIGSISLNVM